MNLEEVLVSIIIPTYNSEDYIAQAIESILHQTYVNFEIILVDDASTDSTIKIARSFHDARIKIIANPENRGVSYGRNCGIEAARGQWIGLLDSDDWYAPQRLEKLMAIAQQHDSDLIADNLFFIQDGQINCWSTLLKENDWQLSSVAQIDAVQFVESDRLPAIAAKRRWSLGYLKPLMRRKFLLENKIRYNESIKVGEDFILYLHCLRKQARFNLVPESYYYYRTRTLSLSTRKPTEYLAQSCTITQEFAYLEGSEPTQPGLLNALSENMLAFQRRLDYYVLLESLKEKSLLYVFKEIVTKPYILDDLFNKIVGWTKKRLASALDFKTPEYTQFPSAYVEKKTLFPGGSK